MDQVALKDAKKFFLYEFEDSINNIYIDGVSWFRLCKVFLFYFIVYYKERLLERHRCIVVFVKLKMFWQEDNKEQDVSINDSCIAEDIFSQYWICQFLDLLGHFNI